MVTSASNPLAIAIIGVGKIGSCFAYQLARSGHHVTVVARPQSQRLAQLQRDGGIVSVGGERIAVTVRDTLDAQTPYDLVIVTTLAHQVDAILPMLRDSRASAIAFMFNIFDPERLVDAIGEKSVSFGMPMVLAALDRGGRLTTTISANRRTIHGEQRWVALFEASGIPSVLEPDMMGWLRCHVPICIGMEAVAVAAKRRNGGASWRETMVVAQGMAACFSIIKQLGHPVFPRDKAILYRTPVGVVASMMWAVSRVPMIRDGFSDGLQECSALIGDVLAVARRSGRAIEPGNLRKLEKMRPDL